MKVPRDLASLELLVQERTSESTILEFKRELPEPGRNDELSRDMAALANTEGGVLIFGVSEDKEGNAESLTPIKLARSAERVLQIAQSIDEPVPIGEALQISDGSKDGTGYLVVVIERGSRRPHLVRGLALGRSPRNVFPLTRRRVGELYADSEGFAEEFKLSSARAGRLSATSVNEVRPGSLSSTDSYLILRNDGEADIFKANWAGQRKRNHLTLLKIHSLYQCCLPVHP